MINKRPLKWTLSAILLCLATLLWGNSAYISAKAVLAQHLIATAWQESLQTHQPVKPWRWADNWPVAELYFPNQNARVYALAGSHGTSLAFGPGHIDGTALPDESGTKVFSAHRDTHFSFLNTLGIGQTFDIRGMAGRWMRYKVTSRHIVDTRKDEWLIAPEQNQVQLITCYPVDSMLPNPPERLVVVATPVETTELGYLLPLPLTRF